MKKEEITEYSKINQLYNQTENEIYILEEEQKSFEMIFGEKIKENEKLIQLREKLLKLEEEKNKIYTIFNQNK